ncbi:response regulator [Blastopirellula marina]|uniref:Two-component system response regulator n=1 Tax=Blastopirellula marina TaxID=124 RepID=A0A2S8F9P1_9BACT|nr:response regulator [Blastopirellula marina]PQO28883.1 two-component system response regulator [Blastopirellula marina]PTL42156.1 response regulator [Blastopirellula marina]
MIADQISILLVEDDDLDADIVRRSLSKQKITNPLVRARDGLEALKILRGSESQEGLKRPYLILLDLNMPRMSGVEFLDEIRQDEQLRESMIFVLSTLPDAPGLLEGHEKEITGYLTKGAFSETFVNHLNSLKP